MSSPSPVFSASLVATGVPQRSGRIQPRGSEYAVACHRQQSRRDIVKGAGNRTRDPRAAFDSVGIDHVSTCLDGIA